MRSRYEIARRILVFWTLFIGIGAVGGAAMMLLDPTGKTMGMDGMLPYFQVLPFAEVVFQDLAFSGIALFIVNGLTNLAAAGLLLARKKAGVVLGGIFGGIFTPTEASAVAVVYSLIISLFVYKDMSFKELPQVFVEGAVSTATIMVMVGLSSASSYVITTSGLPQQLVSFFSSITNSPVVILLLLNILFLIIGMLMEANAAVVMMTPILLPLLNAFGIDLLQFGIVMSFNLCIGLVTPPVGLCLLLCNQTGETRLSHSLKAMMPMLLISIIVLFLITYVSPLTTLLPSIMAG